MTCKDTFLSKIQFQQLLYVAVCGLPGNKRKRENDDKIYIENNNCYVKMEPKKMYDCKLK